MQQTWNLSQVAQVAICFWAGCVVVVVVEFFIIFFKILSCALAQAAGKFKSQYVKVKNR